MGVLSQGTVGPYTTLTDNIQEQQISGQDQSGLLGWGVERKVAKADSRPSWESEEEEGAVRIQWPEEAILWKRRLLFPRGGTRRDCCVGWHNFPFTAPFGRTFSKSCLTLQAFGDGFVCVLDVPLSEVWSQSSRSCSLNECCISLSKVQKFMPIQAVPAHSLRRKLLKNHQGTTSRSQRGGHIL